MAMYVKLYADLLDSSLWSEVAETRLTWITLLLMADEEGIVNSTAAAIAHRAHVSFEAGQKALDTFMAPDPDSRTPDDDGRRIEKIPGGYLILKYVERRQMRDAKDKRARTRERVRRFRERKISVTCNAHVTARNAVTLPVTLVTPCNAIAEAEAEAEAEAVKIPPTPLEGGDRAELQPELQHPATSSSANATADALVRQFRTRADGLGGMSLSTAREAIRSLLIGPNACREQDLQTEIARVEPGMGVFDFVKRLKRAREPTEQPAPVGISADMKRDIALIFKDKMI